MAESAEFSLIIPAHNEEAVIERCLRTALAQAPDPGVIEIIVAANGCTDRTVEIARKAAPSAIVLQIAKGSKTHAINVANGTAKAFPRIVLDADVECSFSSLSALAEALRQPAVMVVAPAIKIDLSHGNRFIKAYYRAWMKQPFAKAGKGGAGCYGLSKEALESIGEFPDIIGDDIWIHTRFPDDQKRCIRERTNGDAVYSVVRPPSTAWDQVKVEVRRISGNEQVKRDHPSPYIGDANPNGGLRGLLASGAAPFDLLVFSIVKFLVRCRIRFQAWRGNEHIWARDQSSRQQLP